VRSIDSSITTRESSSAVRLMAKQGRWAFWFLVFLGFGIRVYGLEFHSLWLDEAVSVYLASFPPLEIVRQGVTLQEPNPPLYHLALSLWMRIFGSSAGSVRLLSVFAGCLYLPAIHLLGRRLLSRRAAFLASLLAALNPFLVWYSQEARMYALVAMLSVWSLYCFVRALDTPRWYWWTAYVGVTVASLYTHFYAVLLLPAEFIFLLLYARAHRAALRRGVLAWALSLLSFAPWLWRAWELSATTPSWRPALGLSSMLVECLEAFTMRSVPLQGAIRVTALVALGILFLAGLLLPRVPQGGLRRWKWSRGEWRPNVLLALTILLPLMSAYVLSFRQQIFTVYYLIVIVAPFLLTLASAVDRAASSRRAVGLVSLLVVVGLCSYGLCHNWSLDSRKEEWRAAARYVAEHERQGDAILCHIDYTRLPFGYYYRGDAPVFAPFGGPVGDTAQVSSTLEGLADYTTVWLVQSHAEWADPSRAVEAWLAGRFPEVTAQYPPGVEVKGFAARYRMEELPPTAIRISALYDDTIRLVGYELDGGVFSATDDTYHPPSGWIHVTLYWEAVQPPGGDFAAVVRLVDDAHQVWGGSLDRPAGTMRFHPTSSWQVGEILRDDYDVNLNPKTPDGTYSLEVSLLTSSGQEMAVVHEGAQGTAAPLGQVRIESF
jgi:mannosyltransferase